MFFLFAGPRGQCGGVGQVWRTRRRAQRLASPVVVKSDVPRARKIDSVHGWWEKTEGAAVE